MQTSNDLQDPQVTSTSASTVAGDTWTLSQEREFIENLLCQRFNFLLLFYSLVLAGAFATTSDRNFSIVLTIGAIVCSMIVFPTARAQHKLDLIIRELGRRDPAHPARLTDVWSSDLTMVPRLMRPIVRRGRRDVIGYWIPIVCALSLWIAATLAWLGVFND
jgi:hypothetical protein